MKFRFDNRFVDELRGDPDRSRAIREVHAALWSTVAPTPVAAPVLIACSREAAQMIGLDEAEVGSPEFAQVF